MFEIDFADIRPGLFNWMVGGLLAVTFIVFWKWALNRWRVPGFTELINSI